MAKRARGEADWDEIAAIGARLRAARLEAGLSQTEMAAHLDVFQPDVSNWERGVHLPDPRVIARWAEITHADLRMLLLNSPGNPLPASFVSNAIKLASATAA